ncbi:SIR2 family protein [Ligilactobacillus sp. 110_WCHN]|uniref:SIR2 family protein n=1 Tax=Ligilactobacillus sp. 110_WCHN TaxID=3057125 RepID=UPI0026720B71|nr:SIR2 family protein [Ligilactobacillus sp. 110_WCHN]MDO3392646.1 SIR2 family protein [Ligilactobacillus sp. 110_WCHN]
MSNKNVKGTYFYGFNTPKYKQENEKYYKDDTELVQDSGQEFTSQMFKDTVKVEIQNLLNKPYENIVVLAGAGASICENGNKGKTVSQLYDDIKELLENDKDLYTFDDLKNRTIIDKDDENLENILSVLIKAISLFKRIKSNEFSKFIDVNKLDQTVEKIKQRIYQATSEYGFDSNCNHDLLIKKLSRLLPSNSRLNIVTTNYDRLFEEAASSLGFWVFDGFSFSNPPIFDADIFDWKLVKEIPNSKTQELKYRSNMINLLKIHGSVDWERDEKGQLIKILTYKQKDVISPVMIFPSSEKYMQSYQEPYFSLMTKFQELLRKPNTLFMTIGFSFADNHIFEMILQSIKHNNSLSTLITDYTLDDDKNPNWEKLSEKSEVYDIHFLKGALNNDLLDYL